MGKESNHFHVRQSINFNDWDRFIIDHPNGNIFQSPHMFKVYKKTKNHKPIFVAVVNEKEELCGVLLAVVQSEHKGILGVFSSRSIIMGGPLIKNDDQFVMGIILKAYTDEIKSKVIFSEIRNLHNCRDQSDIFCKANFIYDPHLDILINLKKKEEELMNSIQKNKKRNYTKSTNKGVCFKEVNDEKELQEGFKLINSTYDRVKLPKPADNLFICAIELLSPNFIKVFGAYSDSKIIGIRIILTYKKMIYDWYAGSDNESRNMYPNDFLILKILLWGGSNHFSIFDFGGAGKPNVPYGVRDHKMKFGGELVEFGRYIKIHNRMLYKIGLFGLQVLKILK
jgi:serine/alanine adding enzyme